MGLGILCTGKRAPIYGHEDTLNWQKGPHTWAWGHFALEEWLPYLGSGTLFTGKKDPIYGHGDTLHEQRGPHIWARGNVALAKRRP